MYAAKENSKSKKNHVHEYELLYLVFMEQLSQFNCYGFDDYDHLPLQSILIGQFIV